MLMNAILPLAAATMASAHKVIVAPRQVVAPPGSTPSISPEDRLPDTIGSSFVFYGCVSSDNQFPNFQPATASDEMDLDFCAASCETQYFGVAGNTCYCADDIDEANTTIERSDKCDTPCPGNPLQACGGVESTNNKRDVAVGLLLTIYVRDVDDNDNDNGGETATATVTATVTETGTVTACPDHDGGCKTGPYTSTRTIITHPTHHPGAGVPGNVVCYGNYCIFDANCESCQNKRVVCNGDACNIQECGPNDIPHRLVVCIDDECNYNECHGPECERKIVCVGEHCAPVECYGDECKKNLVCYGDECDYQQCHGDDCYCEVECQGEECYPIPAPEHPAVPSKPEVPAPVHPCQDCDVVPAPPMKTPGGNHGGMNGGNKGDMNGGNKGDMNGGNKGDMNGGNKGDNGDMPPFSGAGAIVPAMLGVVAGFVALL